MRNDIDAYAPDRGEVTEGQWVVTGLLGVVTFFAFLFGLIPPVILPCLYVGMVSVAGLVAHITLLRTHVERGLEREQVNLFRLFNKLSPEYKRRVGLSYDIIKEMDKDEARRVAVSLGDLITLANSRAAIERKTNGKAKAVLDNIANVKDAEREALNNAKEVYDYLKGKELV